MDKIVVYDTSHTTDNLGDNIIMDSVWREMKLLFPEDFFVTVHTHDILGKRSKAWINDSRLGFVGGTNLLCSNWWWYRSWQLSMRDMLDIKQGPVLLGVGWLEYQRKTDPVTAWLLRRMLSRDKLHSVRDSYVKKRLNDIGIQNVVNTACPTMWDLTEDHCAQIPVRKAPAALVTLTAYRPKPEDDRRWLESILDRYDKVYFWSQMYADLEYAKSIIGDRLEIIPPTLAAFDNLLEEEDVDYIGTRLHGGIRALQKKRRALILEIDARSIEIARDTGLPTVPRNGFDAIVRWIEQPGPVRIKLPVEEIARWRGQFGAPARIRKTAPLPSLEVAHP